MSVVLLVLQTAWLGVAVFLVRQNQRIARSNKEHDALMLEFKQAAENYIAQTDKYVGILERQNNDLMEALRLKVGAKA